MASQNIYYNTLRSNATLLVKKHTKKAPKGSIFMLPIKYTFLFLNVYRRKVKVIVILLSDYAAQVE